MSQKPARLAYLFTTFPKATETFLQREILAMQALGAELHLFSLWGGGGLFQGLQVHTFPKARLLTLLWMIPLRGLQNPRLLAELLKGVCTRRAPSWLNFWENMLGAGFACLYAGRLRRLKPDLVHAAWGGAPATAAWLLWRLEGLPFSAGAHAYDLFEHGGDWWLREKLLHARFIHTSTALGRRTLLEKGLPPDKVHTLRRGLTRWPAFKTLRPNRDPLRLLCVARLVPKKGLDFQLRLYAALQASGLAFEARLVGEGPLGPSLRQLKRHLGLGDGVTFTGHLSQDEVWAHYAWADVLLHTGIIAPSGDRDGLPNVLPEAMSAGVLVLSSPTAATTEAVQDGLTGLVAPLDSTQAWLQALLRLQKDDLLCEHLRARAWAWTERHYDAHKNAAALYQLFLQAADCA